MKHTKYIKKTAYLSAGFALLWAMPASAQSQTEFEQNGISTLSNQSITDYFNATQNNKSAEEINQFLLDLAASQTETKNPSRPPYKTRKIHENAPVIIDMHSDTFVVSAEEKLHNRISKNFWKKGHVDIPRMIKGNVSLQVFSAYSKGSLDIMGRVVPGFTGVYVDADGNEHDRYSYVRDPDILEYDDPAIPYAQHYGAWGVPRDLGTYGWRVSRASDENPMAFCETWFDTKPWPETKSWPPTSDCPQYDEDREYLERILDVGRRFDLVAAADPRFVKITDMAGLDQLLATRNTDKNITGGMLSTEGLYFRGDATTTVGETRLRGFFDEMYSAGFRMFSLTHFIDNDHGGAATGMGRAIDPLDGRPLSPTGALMVDLVFEHNAIMDIAHSSRATMNPTIDKAIALKRSVVYSHGGIQNAPQLGDNSDCTSTRNISDADIIRIAQTGGVIGIGYAPDFICGIEPISWASAVRYAVDLIDGSGAHLYADPSEAVLRGIDHIGMGSDYDGGVKTYTDIANLDQYTHALVCKKTWFTPKCLDTPFSEAEAHQILGQNVLRVFRENLSAP